MNDIKDVKPPIDMPMDWWGILWVVLAAAVIAAAGYFFFKYRKPATIAAAPVLPRSAWEIAHDQLEKLSHKHYPEQGMFKVFYIELSDIVRHYLENRFQIKAPEMTTEEFLNFVKTSPDLRADHKEILKDFLNGCDMVKFAKHVPSVNEAQANFELAKKLIEETYTPSGGV